MLSFFRRHQQILFICTTIVIVISFVFFGTYSALTDQNAASTRKDEVAFTTAAGTPVYVSEVEEMVLFLRTDALDALYSGGALGVNFLNDGVIRNDILVHGLGPSLMEAYQETVADELLAKRDREKSYRTYAHPQVPFIGAEAAWQYFSPELPKYLKQLQETNDVDRESFETRVNLYLAESKFPAAALRQVLVNQQKQQEWVQADPDLDRTDLALFGYHTAEDWFGQRFTHLVAEFVIAAAEQAEELGYVVTMEEATASLLRNAQSSFQQMQGRARAVNSGQYMRGQLQAMQLSETRAANVWQKVLLFRRLFQEAGDSVLVDRWMYEQLNSFARKGVEVELYEFPKELQLKRYEELQQLETYLSSCTDSSGWSEEHPLALPTTFLSPEKVQAIAPELVQRRYLLTLKSVSKSELQTRVGVREMWAWQGAEANWDLLVKRFPELGQAQVADEEGRIAAIDALPEAARTEADIYSRSQIVEAHPEWIEEALRDASSEKVVVSLRMKGGKLPFEGVKDRKALMEMLDSEDEIAHYSPDGKHHYQVAVQDRGGVWELMRYKEAKTDRTLVVLAERRLKEHYEKIRRGNVRAYRDESGEWRPLSEVSTQVADNLYSGILRDIKNDYVEQGGAEEELDKKTSSFWARQRLAYPLRVSREEIIADPTKAEALVVTPSESGELASRTELSQQWKLAKRTVTVRRDIEGNIPVEPTLAMAEGEWSDVQQSETSSPYFFQVGQEKVDETELEEMMLKGQKLLSYEAQQALMDKMMTEIAENAPFSVAHTIKG